MKTWRDDVEAADPSIVPVLRSFPIELYADILRTGRAAASKKRYPTRVDATRDASTVCKILRYYSNYHPDIAPIDFGYRVWESAEDGRYRWAILPEAQRAHRKRTP